MCHFIVCFQTLLCIPVSPWTVDVCCAEDVTSRRTNVGASSYLPRKLVGRFFRIFLDRICCLLTSWRHFCRTARRNRWIASTTNDAVMKPPAPNDRTCTILWWSVRLNPRIHPNLPARSGIQTRNHCQLDKPCLFSDALICSRRKSCSFDLVQGATKAKKGTKTQQKTGHKEKHNTV